MRLGIDASNLRAGGGLTYLRELIRHADPNKFGFTEIIIWAPESTLEKLVNHPWLIKRCNSVMSSALSIEFIYTPCNKSLCKIFFI